MQNLDDLAADPRVTVRKPGAPNPEGRCVVYWMQRAHRGLDNPALDVAVAIANRLGLPAVVYLAPIPWYPRANARHYAFLQQGIPDVRARVEARDIGFVLRRYPDHSLDRFLQEVDPAMLIGDENPMREPQHWRAVVTRRSPVPFWTVDADVIVPSRLFAKEQYAAFQMKKKLYAQLDTYLVDQPNLRAAHQWSDPKGLENISAVTDITAGWNIDRSVAPVDTFRGGTEEALRLLQEFIANKLPRYAERRNQAHLDGTSRLSPYLHFGHISPLTVALAVQKAHAPAAQKEAFFNELILWRELAINFVTYNQHYESLESADRWARESLSEHARDQREHRYALAKLEAAETHDELWNAAQLQMVNTGWMHNYMRMYWAKKILEWTPSARKAYEICVLLNDKYLLDGRDPNGYAGIAWAIAAKRDRPWFEKPVNGRIRTMTASGAARKFDTQAYIAEYGRGGAPTLFGSVAAAAHEKSAGP